MSETTIILAIPILAIAGILGAAVDQGKRGGGAMSLAIGGFISVVYPFWLVFDATRGNIGALCLFGWVINFWLGAASAVVVFSYLGIECYINHSNKGEA